MAPTRSLLLILLASGLAFAQTPLFNDGTAFGGSKVFAEGLNPFGNAARFNRAATGTYLTWIQGNDGAKDTFEALKNPTLFSGLTENSRAIRTRAYGIAYVDKGVHSSFLHEETTAAIVNPNFGTALPNSIELRRSVVDRTCVGAGDFDQGSGYGVVMRVERWRTGSAINPQGLSDYLSYSNTQTNRTLVTFDLGYALEITQGIRFGATVDRVLPRHFGDVYEGPQARAGFQVDLGDMAQLSVETDINKAMRMPYPIRQRVSAVSLRIPASPILTLTFGAEHRKLGDQAQTRGGFTLFLNSPTWRLGAGFQFSQERPLAGLTFSGF
ncbi:MAG: hypothetical protein Q8O00_09640 [Holophaga sp.]|nr:hypothetical protein [Holophaga sp.]